ncbi:MFS transporter [Sulfodiicoccus acidiphilus]
MELSFLYAVVIGLVYPLVPLYLKEEGVGVLLVSVALSGISASSFVSTLLWGRVADSHEKRSKVVWITTVGGAVSYLLAATRPPVPVLVGSLVGANAFAPGVIPAAMASVSEAEDSRSRMSYFWIGGSLGYSLGTAVTGYVLEKFNVTPIFLTSAILLLLILATNRSPPPTAEVDVKVGGIPRSFWLFALVTVLFLFTDVAKNLYIPAFFAFHLHTGTAFATATLSVEAALEVPMIFLFSRVLRKGNSWRVMGVSVLLGAMYLTVNAAAFNWVSALLTMCSYSLVWGSFSVSSSSIVSELVSRDKRGTAYGVYNAALPIANVVGPLYVGATLASLGYRLGLVTISIPLVLIGVTILLTKSRGALPYLSRRRTHVATEDANRRDDTSKKNDLAPNSSESAPPTTPPTTEPAE